LVIEFLHLPTKATGDFGSPTFRGQHFLGFEKNVIQRSSFKLHQAVGFCEDFSFFAFSPKDFHFAGAVLGDSCGEAASKKPGRFCRFLSVFPIPLQK
jgi:hypothetical protein